MRLSIFFVILIFLCRCNSGRAEPEDNAVATIRRQYADWLTAYQRKDLARTMEIFAPDVISTFAGATDSDLAAMLRSYEKSFAPGRAPRQWKPVDLEVLASGDLAYALSDWQLLEQDSNGAFSVRQTNRSIDLLKRDGEEWKIIRSFTIPQDGREVKLSCEVTLPHVLSDTFRGTAHDVWQTLMRWRDSYNARDLSGTMAPYDPSITGLYAGNSPDNFTSLRESYTRSFAAKDRQRSIEFEPEEILASGTLAFVRDHWTSTLRTQAGDNRRLSRGIEVWRRNEGGEWKLMHYLSYAVCNSTQNDNSTEPVMVGEGIISTPQDEFGGSLSPDGKTIYFDRSVPAHYLYTMWESHLVGDKWQAPELMSISGQYRDSDPVLSPDGKKLLFVSDRPVNGVDRHHYEIWMCHRQGEKWSEPQNLGPVVNTRSQYFASMASNGNLYFSATIADDDSEIDIFVSKFANEKYTTPVNLGPAINGKGIVNIEAFVSPDEKFLLIGAFNRPDSVGSSDIYVSYNRDGTWSAPLAVTAINTPAREYSPRLTPDGQRLIYTSERGMGTEQRTKPWTMPEFEQKSRSVWNGLGNIYSISTKVLPKPTE
jgi:ketosteroid isomerase-like protein